MGQRSCDVAVKDAQTKPSVVECALGTEQIACRYFNYWTRPSKEAQIDSSIELKCAPNISFCIRNEEYLSEEMTCCKENELLTWSILFD